MEIYQLRVGSKLLIIIVRLSFYNTRSAVRVCALLIYVVVPGQCSEG